MKTCDYIKQFKGQFLKKVATFPFLDLISKYDATKSKKTPTSTACNVRSRRRNKRKSGAGSGLWDG